MSAVHEDANGGFRPTAAAGRRLRSVRSRGMLYAVVSELLARPTPALSQLVTQGELRETVRHAARGSSRHHHELCNGGEILQAVALLGREPIRDALAIEYARLFSNGLVCPHNETDYVPSTSFGALHAVADVVRLYSAFGVRVAENAAERPDHIAIELQFMQWLLMKEAYAIERGQKAHVQLSRQAQRIFLKQHLLRWASAFARRLLDTTTHPAYRFAAVLLLGLLAAEARHLRLEGSDVPAHSHACSASSVDATTGASCGECHNCE